MSQQTAVAYDFRELPVFYGRKLKADLCQRVDLRNYSDHQALQQEINQDWISLLLQPANRLQGISPY